MPGAARLFVLFLYAHLFAILAGDLLGRGSLVTIASHSRAQSSLFLYAHLFAFLAGNIFSVEVAWSLSQVTVVRKGNSTPFLG
jgi:hypothetical protein